MTIDFKNLDNEVNLDFHKSLLKKNIEFDNAVKFSNVKWLTEREFDKLENLVYSERERSIKSGGNYLGCCRYNGITPLGVVKFKVNDIITKSISQSRNVDVAFFEDSMFDFPTIQDLPENTVTFLVLGEETELYRIERKVNWDGSQIENNYIVAVERAVIREENFEFKGELSISGNYNYEI
jgi:hypothetical protein